MAEKLLREIVAQEPELYEVSYSLGLLLAEMQQYKDAEIFLSKAAGGMNYGRAHYNHGQILMILDQPDQAEQALLKSLQLDPKEQDFFVALVDLYLKSDQTDKARLLTSTMIQRFPDHRAALELLRYLGK